ncbi:MAG: hypothetical protein WC465_01490 [Patescibacteria group bacterium]
MANSVWLIVSNYRFIYKPLYQQIFIIYIFLINYYLYYGYEPFYQLDLVTPGISPLSANSLKQMRQRSNSPI